MWLRKFAGGKTKSLEGLLGQATWKDGARPLRTREQAADVASPLYREMKSLPQLQPWQRELVPWATGAVEYAERYGSMARSIRLWRLAFFVTVVAAVLRDTQTAKSIERLAARPAAEAYMFEACNGTARAVMTAERVGDPDEPRILAAIGAWAEHLHTVELEPAANTGHVAAVMAMVSKGTAAHAALDKWFAVHDPYAPLAKTEAQVFPPTRVGSSNRVKVEWVERTKFASGKTEEAHYSQFVTYAISHSSRYEDLAANLFGIYVTEFSDPSRLR